MGHWYLPNTGEPLYEVEKKAGGMRPATIRDARPLGAVPSVTTILGVLDKPGLRNYFADQHIDATLRWAADLPTDRYIYLAEMVKAGNEALNADIRKRIKRFAREHAKTAADDGTAIHDAIESYFQHDRIHPQYHETVTAVIAMLQEKCGPQQWEAEKWFASPLGYGGKIDLISPEWVIDFKTKPGNAEDHKMYDEQLIQLVAYHHGLPCGEAMTKTMEVIPSPRRFANIIVSRDIPGSVAWWSWDDADEQRAWETFRAALTIWKNQNRYWPDETPEAAD